MVAKETCSADGCLGKVTGEGDVCWPCRKRQIRMGATYRPVVYEGLYLVELGPVRVKVGMSRNTLGRIKTHVSTAWHYAGYRVTRYAYMNIRTENETLLLGRFPEDLKVANEFFAMPYDEALPIFEDFATVKKAPYRKVQL